MEGNGLVEISAITTLESFTGCQNTLQTPIESLFIDLDPLYLPGWPVSCERELVSQGVTGKEVFKLISRITEIILAVFLLLVSVQVNASIISYNFSGTLSTVNDTGNLLGGVFSIGDTFTGSVSYESESPDGAPSPTYFTSPAMVDISAVINEYIFITQIGSVDLNSDVEYIFSLPDLRVIRLLSLAIIQED